MPIDHSMENKTTENSIACLTIHICLDQNRKINMETDKPSFTV